MRGHFSQMVGKPLSLSLCGVACVRGGRAVQVRSGRWWGRRLAARAPPRPATPRHAPPRPAAQRRCHQKGVELRRCTIRLCRAARLQETGVAAARREGARVVRPVRPLHSQHKCIVLYINKCIVLYIKNVHFYTLTNQKGYTLIKV